MESKFVERFCIVQFVTVNPAAISYANFGSPLFLTELDALEYANKQNYQIFFSILKVYVLPAVAEKQTIKMA